MKYMRLAVKIDVDTERGTRVGVPALLDLFAKYGVQATFLFSMGPDNTGRAVRRIFRKGFFSKVRRTGVVQVYGLRTLLNGLLWPGPDIAKLNAGVMREAHARGHETGVHCYDHIKWQDHLHRMSEPQVREQVHKARKAFEQVFGFAAKVMGAAGWQADRNSLAAYDDCNLLYASDTRGTQAFFPAVGRRQFSTLQVPTTLPTLDELLGRPEYPLDAITRHYLDLITPGTLNVLTIHAELEGMRYLEWFDGFLAACVERDIEIVPVRTVALDILRDRAAIPCLQLQQGTVDGRSGTLACHEPHLKKAG